MRDTEAHYPSLSESPAAKLQREDRERSIEACSLPHIQIQLDMIMPPLDFKKRLEDAYMCGYQDGIKSERNPAGAKRSASIAEDKS